ncbi:MAG: conditioned medium factor, partial [Planctomycetota bacterium]|nr:conditioned medium factor [Planctomycetota bacterium]
VGVPWLGTALAGNAAVLGEVFGIGCGEVYDLTYDGSTSWLSFIPSWVRQETWYWTTSFEDGWFYDYCQIVTDLLLSDPDDGTVEQYAGQLAGANNEGHKTGWCHTRLMRDPPQCRDVERNVLMNQEAAR